MHFHTLLQLSVYFEVAVVLRSLACSLPPSCVAIEDYIEAGARRALWLTSQRRWRVMVLVLQVHRGVLKKTGQAIAVKIVELPNRNSSEYDDIVSVPQGIHSSRKHTRVA
jgi:hypothetical protein